MRNCYDCDNAVFDYEEYYGGYKQKIVVGCKIGNVPEDGEDGCREDEDD